MVSKVYYTVKSETQVSFVTKQALEEALNKELSALKKENEKEYKKVVSERTEFTEKELNPKNLFRIYYDQCILFNSGFYA
eukprot:CAMPEP_0170514960 /NCGR_PEP_ID=MMETSP0209-20121228/1456_1 /TAXON_ID=665100 ORGANISM="Litonotus pictus, Strain P1" /NCGR_SAMPLE_ID=MMETSP0209 /ASSEMBLY_ACC=CAM_ASM_000301 /LENGTH=79 /DNA_ID=CAMNT_0010799235 /DNA_START=248 /DNA_END=490 /DNA_ORIENTATION=+